MPKCKWPGKIVPVMVLLMLIMLSCTGTPSDASSESTPLAPESPSESPRILDIGDTFRVSGQESMLSEPFRLQGTGVLNAYYRQDCSEFVLKMVNTNPSLAEAPYGTVVFAAARQPSESTEEDPYNLPFEYVPGEYQLDVHAVGPCRWEVWLVVKPSEK